MVVIDILNVVTAFIQQTLLSTNKRQYSKSWHNFGQSNLCCNIDHDQSLDIKLNPYAIENTNLMKIS